MSIWIRIHEEISSQFPPHAHESRAEDRRSLRKKVSPKAPPLSLTKAKWWTRRCMKMLCRFFRPWKRFVPLNPKPNPDKPERIATKAPRHKQ